VTTTGGTAADLLETIVAATRRTVEVRQQRVPVARLAQRADARRGAGGRFRAVLAAGDRVNIIAECKRRSPSRGVLRASYDPAAIARSYVEAGAVAISVLTESTFFDGSLEHLEEVRAAVGVPVLRKDFIVSEYQLFEASAAGADAVLLIVAALQPAELERLIVRADGLGLDALIEVHTGAELGTALDAGARIVGVNNRNLRTLEIDVHASEALIERVPGDVLAVSESGLRAPADVMRLRAIGYRAFLIGERFMAAEDPGQELRRLLEGCDVTDVTKDTKDDVTKDA
jgi:indole-3-glycerol phosphate synthase